jgi:hypothetical protein
MDNPSRSTAADAVDSLPPRSTIWQPRPADRARAATMRRTGRRGP